MSLRRSEATAAIPRTFRKPLGIATPVCALVRDDTFQLEGEATSAAKSAAHALHLLAHTRAGELLDELLHLLEGLQQLVDILHLQTAAGSDTLFPGGGNDVGLFPLFGSHGQDDGLGVGQGLGVQLHTLQP